MPADDPVLTRSYAPADLWPQLPAAGVSGTVLAQAAPTLQETEYLLGIADATPWVKGVVGWIDFADPADAAHLARHTAFKGVRPMIQHIPDDGWMHRSEVQWAYAAIIDHDLTFDALGFPRHLDTFLALLQRYPAMRVVPDHCMKPHIRAHSAAGFRHWADGMGRWDGPDCGSDRGILQSLCPHHRGGCGLDRRRPAALRRSRARRLRARPRDVGVGLARMPPA